jgi:hypothetical protein
MLGNYCQSVNRLFGCHPKLLIDQNVLADPEVGHYCAILSTKSSFRNSVGEAVSAKLSKFSFAVAACALNKCGLPVSYPVLADFFSLVHPVYQHILYLLFCMILIVELFFSTH